MTWLTVAGGVFLVWLVLVFLFTPGVNDHFLLDDERDLADSVEATLETWARRPIREKRVEPMIWILERQQ